MVLLLRRLISHRSARTTAPFLTATTLFAASTLLAAHRGLAITPSSTPAPASTHIASATCTTERFSSGSSTCVAQRTASFSMETKPPASPPQPAFKPLRSKVFTFSEEFGDAAVVVGNPVGALAMNQYLVYCKSTKEAAFVDLGTEDDDEFDPFASYVEDNGLTVKYLLLTHGHFDHIAGLSYAKQKYPDAQILLHEADLPVARGARTHAGMYGMSVTAPPDPEVFITENQLIHVGDLVFKAIHTPGHCPGHVVLHEEANNFAFCGDLIFQGSIGRTDLPLSDGKAMAKSLRKACDSIGGQVRLYPGHMGATTMGAEKASNPFLLQICG